MVVGQEAPLRPPCCAGCSCALATDSGDRLAWPDWLAVGLAAFSRDDLGLFHGFLITNGHHRGCPALPLNGGKSRRPCPLATGTSLSYPPFPLSPHCTSRALFI